MGLMDYISKLNAYLEEKYSKVLDFFENKGLPAYKYNDWLEMHGVPAMWFTIIMIVGLIILIFVVVYITLSLNVNLTVDIRNNLNEPINMPINLNIANDDVLFSGSVKSGDKLLLKGLSLGDTLNIKATLNGYTLVRPQTFVITEENLVLTLVLTKNVTTEQIRFRIINGQTDSIVSNAIVSLYDQAGNLIGQVTSDNDGYATFNSAPLGERLSIKVQGDNYLQFDDVILTDKENKIALMPSEIKPGEKGKFKFVVKANDEPINNALIEIYDDKSKALIGNVETDAEGVALFELAKGTIIRFVVKKEGYANYDSNELGITRTLQSDLEIINVNLTIGGAAINIIVKEGELPIENVLVQLYNNDNALISNKTTNIYGMVDFDGLKLVNKYYVSVAKEGYYSNTIQLDLTNKTDYVIDIKKYNMSDVAIINLFVVDTSNRPININNLQVYKKINNNYVPYATNTDMTLGVATLYLEPDFNYKIDGYNESLQGSIEFLAIKGKNQEILVLEPIGGMVRINVYDVENNLVNNAQITVKSRTGNILYDGLLQNGSVEFLSQGNVDLIVDIIDASNKLYSKIVRTAKIIDIRLDVADAIDMPLITFLGYYNANNEKVSVLQPNKTYNARFKISWPTFVGNGGLHVRVGEDNVDFDKQDYAILSADAPNVNNYKYGLYYNSTPLPGNYSKDYGVSGRVGLNNKWVELNYNSPLGTSEINVRIKIKNTDVNTMKLSYRVWINKDNKYVRNPADPILENNFDSVSRASLYANTYSEITQINKMNVDCRDNYCMSYQIKDDLMAYDSFYPVAGNVYALDLELFSVVDDTVNVSFNTNNVLDNVLLNNISQDLISFNPNQESSYRLELANVRLEPNKKVPLRLYFTANKKGNGFINIIVVGKSVLEKQINFIISDKRDMQITINNRGLINVGENVILTARDSTGFIDDAFISVFSATNNEIIHFIKGDNTTNNGANGSYLISNLISGDYKVVVRSAKHVTKEINFSVTRLGILSVPTEVEVRIPEGMKSITYNFEIRNLSNMDIRNLQYETIRDNSNEFNYSLNFLRGYLQKKNKMPVAVDLSTEADGIVYGDSEIMISGILPTGEIVRATTHLKFINSTNYDSKCLEVLPNQLKISLPDFPNSKQEVVFMLENKCTFDLMLEPSIISRDGQEKGVSLSLFETRLKIGEKRTIKGELVNNVARDSEGLKAEMFINFKTDYFNKQIPTTLEIWKTMGSISINLPRVSYVYSGQDSIVPVYITNNGNLPLRNVRLTHSQNLGDMINDAYVTNYDLLLSQPQINNSTISNSYNPFTNTLTSINNDTINNYMVPGSVPYAAGNHNMTFQPNIIETINPGDTATIRLRIVSRNQINSQETTYLINASGLLQGATTPIQANGLIQVVSSSNECFKVKGVDNGISRFSFVSTTLGRTTNPKVVRFENKCAEPVIVSNLSANDVGGNTISLTPLQNNVVAPNSVSEFSLNIFANNAGDITTSDVYVVSRLLYSNRPIFTQLFIETHFGPTATRNQINAQEPVKRITLNYCESTESASFVMPKIGNMCESTYCDGESFSKYVMAKVDTYYTNFRAKYDRFVGQNVCSSNTRQCSFENYGIESPIFDLYLLNDTINPLYIQQKLFGTNQSLVNVQIYSNDMPIDTLFGAKKLYLPTELSGCGKYTLQIEGLLDNVASIVDPAAYSVKIKLLEKVVMPECKQDVLNAGIFLPKDVDTDIENQYGLLPGYVNWSDPSLDKFGKSFSKSWFGKERQSSGKANTIMFSKQSIDGLLEMRINDDALTPTIDVVINNNVDVRADAQVNDLTLALTSYLSAGSFNGCISRDKKVVKVNSAVLETTGEIKIDGCDQIIFAENYAHCDFSVISTTTTTSFNLSVDSTTNLNPKFYDLTNMSEITGLYTLRYSSQAGRLQNPFRLTVNVDNISDTIRELESRKPTLLITNDNATLQSKTMNVSLCGTTPTEFASKLIGLRTDNNIRTNQSNYWSIITWNDNLATNQSICDAFAENIELNDGKGDYILSSTMCPNLYSPTTTAKQLSERIDSANYFATGVGFTACVVSKLGLAVVGGPLSWGGVLVGCGLPIGSLFVEQYSRSHKILLDAGLTNKTWLDKSSEWMDNNPLMRNISSLVSRFMDWISPDHGELPPDVRNII